MYRYLSSFLFARLYDYRIFKKCQVINFIEITESILPTAHIKYVLVSVAMDKLSIVFLKQNLRLLRHFHYENKAQLFYNRNGLSIILLKNEAILLNDFMLVTTPVKIKSSEFAYIYPFITS